MVMEHGSLDGGVDSESDVAVTVLRDDKNWPGTTELWGAAYFFFLFRGMVAWNNVTLTDKGPETNDLSWKSRLRRSGSRVLPQQYTVHHCRSLTGKKFAHSRTTSANIVKS
jgi:hypothetical protein